MASRGRRGSCSRAGAGGASAGPTRGWCRWTASPWRCAPRACCVAWPPRSRSRPTATPSATPPSGCRCSRTAPGPARAPSPVCSRACAGRRSPGSWCCPATRRRCRRPPSRRCGRARGVATCARWCWRRKAVCTPCTARCARSSRASSSAGSRPAAAAPGPGSRAWIRRGCASRRPAPTSTSTPPRRSPSRAAAARRSSSSRASAAPARRPWPSA